jgi:hypothetical protein
MVREAESEGQFWIDMRNVNRDQEHSVRPSRYSHRHGSALSDNEDAEQVIGGNPDGMSDQGGSKAQVSKHANIGSKSTSRESANSSGSDTKSHSRGRNNAAFQSAPSGRSDSSSSAAVATFLADGGSKSASIRHSQQRSRNTPGVKDDSDHKAGATNTSTATANPSSASSKPHRENRKFDKHHQQDRRDRKFKYESGV